MTDPSASPVTLTPCPMGDGKGLGPPERGLWPSGDGTSSVFAARLRRTAMSGMRSVVAVAALATAIIPAAAQDWPTRPVTLIVPFAAGGGFDVEGRFFAQRMSESLGQPVIVENIGGAAGAI